MSYFAVSIICLIAGFVGGALFYHNNADRIEEDTGNLRALLDDSKRLAAEYEAILRSHGLLR